MSKMQQSIEEKDKEIEKLSKDALAFDFVKRDMQR